LVVLAFAADGKFNSLDYVTQFAHLVSVYVRLNHLFVYAFVDVAFELIDVHQSLHTAHLYSVFVFEQKLLHH
jgi:hypothetical protein